MADQATERTTIAASPRRCYEVALDFESYPEWALDVKEVVVLDRDGAGRATRVAFRAAAMGHSAHYVLRYEYSQVPMRMSWQLEQADIMNRLDGTYEFDPVEGDPEATSVTYHLAVELSVPLPGFVKRRAESKIVATALEELKARCETGLG